MQIEAQKSKSPLSLKFRLAGDGDVPALRTLLTDSYRELADLGMNFTAATQDEQQIREQMGEGRTLVLEREGRMVGTMNMYQHNLISGRKSAYLRRLAIDPAEKRKGLGSLMMDFAEKLASEEGFECVQLDTAKPAEHLVDLYRRRGYEIVGTTRWDGKTYESWIMEKTLS